MKHLGVLLLLPCVMGALVPGCANTSLPTSPFSPLPSPTTSTVPPTAPISLIPTALATKGVVTGTLLRWSSTESLPEAELYLASVITATDNVDFRLIALEPDSDPRAEMDALTGTFVFTDVEPALYAVAIVSPFGSALINEPAESNALTFSVVAGQIVDLGVVYSSAGW